MNFTELNREFIEKINKTKDEAIKYRCKKLNIPVPSEANLKSRFDKFRMESHQDKGEALYYNDGSKNGVFIVAFRVGDYESNPINFDFRFNFYVLDVEPDWCKSY